MLQTRTDPYQLVLTNRQKVFWPGENYTKGDLLDYYQAIAPVIVPYLVDRPQVIHRHPDGHQGKEFFQRISKHQPLWVETATVRVSSRHGERTFVLCQNWPTLLWLANFGCIELIPWNSRMASLDRPDYLVIDLDPLDVPFDRVVEVAQAVHRLLDKIGAANYCKTSGKRGLHIYVPLGAKYPFPQAKLFGEILARLVFNQLPEITSLHPARSQRQGLVYLDQSRNARGQAVAVAYCCRPYPGASVSTPLKWSEVKRGLDPSRFNIKMLPGRVEKLGDLWEPVLGPGIDMAGCLERAQRLVQPAPK